MKTKNWSKKFLWFVLGAFSVGFLSFVSTSDAQQSKLVKLIMRFGEERVLEDGTKVGVSKGEGDLIVVTLSKDSSTQSSEGSNSSADLKLGTYMIKARQSFDSFGFTQEENVTVSLRIESIDRNGKVKAHLSLGLDEGQLKGRVNDKGVLELDGVIGSQVTILGQSRFTLKATVEDDTLTNGEYLKVRTKTNDETKGVFRLGSLKKDF